jgi:hypothetical protein
MRPPGSNSNQNSSNSNNGNNSGSQSQGSMQTSGSSSSTNAGSSSENKGEDKQAKMDDGAKDKEAKGGGLSAFEAQSDVWVCFSLSLFASQVMVIHWIRRFKKP